MKTGGLLKPSLYGHIRDQREFYEARNRIFSRKHGFNVKIAKGLQEIGETRAARCYINDAGGEVGQETDPRDTWPSATGFDGAGKLISIQETRKINAGMSSESVITPSTSIDIEQ